MGGFHSVDMENGVNGLGVLRIPQNEGQSSGVVSSGLFFPSQLLRTSICSLLYGISTLLSLNSF